MTSLANNITVVAYTGLSLTSSPFLEVRHDCWKFKNQHFLQIFFICKKIQQTRKNFLERFSEKNEKNSDLPDFPKFTKNRRILILILTLILIFRKLPRVGFESFEPPSRCLRWLSSSQKLGCWSWKKRRTLHLDEFSFSIIHFLDFSMNFSQVPK